MMSGLALKTVEAFERLASPSCVEPVGVDVAGPGGRSAAGVEVVGAMRGGGVDGAGALLGGDVVGE